MNLRRCAVGVGAVCAWLVAPLVHAAPLDDRIPQDAIFYVGWQGADGLAPQYAKSDVKGLMDASGLPAYLTQEMPKWIALAGEQDPTAPARIQAAMTGLGILWHHASALYVGPADFTNPQQPQARAAFLCDAGADASALTTLLQMAIAQSNPPAAAHIAVTNNQGLVLLTIGLTTADELQPHGATALQSSPRYMQAMQQVGGSDGAVTFYGDPQGFLAMIDGGVDADKTVKAEDRDKYRAVVEALGLRSLTQAAYRAGFKEKGWTEDVFVGAEGPHQGLLALLDGAPIDNAALAVIPQEALSFSVQRFDVSKVLPLVRDIAARIDPRMVEEFNKGLEQVQQRGGLDIEKDVIAPLGDVSVVYRAPSADGVGLMAAMVQKVKDGDAFAKALTVVEAQINEKGEGRVAVAPTDADGIQVSALQTPVFSVAWTVRNGYFYVSSLSGISQAINQVEKHQPDVTSNETYKAVRAQLPNVTAATIDYSEPAKLYPEAYRSLATALPMLRMLKIDVPLRILPTPAKAAPFLAPTGSISWSDAKGFHSASRSAYPGSAVMGKPRQDGGGA